MLDWLDLVQLTSAAVSSHARQSCHVQKALFCPLPPETSGSYSCSVYVLTVYRFTHGAYDLPSHGLLARFTVPPRHQVLNPFRHLLIDPQIFMPLLHPRLYLARLLPSVTGRVYNWVAVNNFSSQRTAQEL